MTRFHIDYEGGIHVTTGMLTSKDMEYSNYKWKNLSSYSDAIWLLEYLNRRHEVEVKAEFDLGWID